MCNDTFFDSDRKSVAMVTAYYGKNGGKILRRELLPAVFHQFYMKFGRDVLPWTCRCARSHFFRQ